MNASLKTFTDKELEGFEFRIQKAVNKVVIDGKLHYGKLRSNLLVPRRGWVMRGIHPEIAETSHEHSNKLRDAGTAYACHPESDISETELSYQLKVHDHIDGIDHDITPFDDVTEGLTQEMEKYGMKLLYGSITNGFGELMMYHYKRWIAKNTTESIVGTWLDKQCPGTHAQDLKNNIDKLREQIVSNEAYKQHLLQAQETNDFDDGMRKLEKSLDDFYIENIERFSLEENKKRREMMLDIADQVANFKGKNVYEFYFDLLSTYKPKES